MFDVDYNDDELAATAKQGLDRETDSHHELESRYTSDVGEQRDERIIKVKISDIKIGKRLRKKVHNIESLAKSITSQGLLHPILLDEHMNLVAGYRRIKAYEYLGAPEIEARFRNIHNPLQAEYDENVERDDLTMTDVAAIFKAVQASRVGHRPSRKEEGQDKVSNLDIFPKGPSLDVTASITRYSRGKVANMIAVTDAAEQNPEESLCLPHDKRTLSDLVEDVDNIKTTVSEAHNLIKKHYDLKRRREEVETAAKGLNLPDKLVLLNMDSTKLESFNGIIKDNSVDLILTDPPYSRESLYLHEALASFASAKLKEGGSVVFFYGQALEPEIHKIFAKYYPNLKFWCPFYVHLQGPDYGRLHDRNVVVKCKEMPCFVKGENPPLWGSNNVPNFIDSCRPDKAHHEWAQSSVEAEFIIKNLTVSEHALVVDPFLGSGEFGISAIKLRRYFVGIDIDKNTLDYAKLRLSSTSSAEARTDNNIPSKG